MPARRATLMLGLAVRRSPQAREINGLWRDGTRRHRCSPPNRSGKGCSLRSHVQVIFGSRSPTRSLGRGSPGMPASSLTHMPSTR